MECLNKDNKIKRNSQISSTFLDGELVILGNKDFTYYRINKSGICIWNFIHEARSVEEIVIHVANYYGLEPSQVSTDVKSFISLMLEEAIFQYVGQ